LTASLPMIDVCLIAVLEAQAQATKGCGNQERLQPVQTVAW
jgi:hypothetical protein